MDCILHFPENRPISSSGEECLPVLVPPRLTLSLLPTVFNDSATMLCRLNLLCLVHLEADEEEEGRGLAYLFDHLTALLKIVVNQGSREMVVTSFRAVFIFPMHFNYMEKFSEKLVNSLCDLYSRHCRLAPHLFNLADRIQECLEDSVWSVQLLKALQKCIVEMPPFQMTLQDLSWHLKILGRVAQESQIVQRNTICLLLNVLINSNLCERKNWQVGNAILMVCHNLLQHPTLSQMFIELADLLQYMTKRYEDTDIQDHARFYYTLLTKVYTDPRFDRMFTICLYFDLNDSYYAEVNNIYVPCLFKDRKAPQVSLKLKPFQPYPTSLRLSAIFTTEDGLSWHTQLPDVKISFPEIFLPIPLPLGASHEFEE